VASALDRVSVFPAAIRPRRRGLPAAVALLLGAVMAIPVAEASLRGLQHAAAQSPRASGYLGVEFHELSDAEATALHEKGTRGVLIVAVDHDGPAGKAGLRAQDVIIAINGQLAASADLVKRVIHDAGAGVSVALSLVRQGRTMSVSAVLADRTQVERDARAHVSAAPAPLTAGNAPDPVDIEEGSPHFADPPPPNAGRGPLMRGQAFLGTVLHGPFTGLDLETMTSQLAMFFGATDGKGLLVQNVTANSPAFDAGVHAGDVIWKADGVVLRSTAGWTKHVRSAKGGPIVLTVLRDRQQQQITLTLGAKKHSMLEWPRLFGTE
jgi:serine protease Do